MKQLNILQITNLIAVTGVITVNILANSLPINGVSTGQVSADYENLFTPAGFAFSIWSIIYLGLIAFSVYQFQGIWKPSAHKSNILAASVGIIFLLNCIANIFWIFAWHHYQLQLSLILMIFILTTLIDINARLWKVSHTQLSYWTTVVPFGIYLGWICVATIANFAVYLTAINWGGFGIAENTWAIFFTVIAGLIALLLLKYLKLFSAAFAIAWGLFGLYFKMNNLTGYYFYQVIILVVIAIIVLGAARIKRRMAVS